MITMEPKLVDIVRPLIKDFIKDTKLSPHNAGRVVVKVLQNDDGKYNIHFYHPEVENYSIDHISSLSGKIRAQIDEREFPINEITGYGMYRSCEFCQATGYKFKVFISIPMRGYNIDEVHEKILKVYDEKFKGDYELIDQVFDTEMGEVANLGHSIEMLSQADLVYFVPGWELSRGCRLEKRICDVYNIRYEMEPRERTDLLFNGPYKFIDLGECPTAGDLINALITVDQNLTLEDDDNVSELFGIKACDVGSFSIGEKTKTYADVVCQNRSKFMHMNGEHDPRDDSDVEKMTLEEAKKHAIVGELSITSPGKNGKVCKYLGVYYPGYVVQEEFNNTRIRVGGCTYTHYTSKILYVACKWGSGDVVFVSDRFFKDVPGVYAMSGTLAIIPTLTEGTSLFLEGISDFEGRIYLTNPKDSFLILNHEYCEKNILPLIQ